MTGHVDLPEVPDLIGPGLRLLLVGINPSVLSARTGLHFAHPGNRFYPALRAAGVLRGRRPHAEDAAPLLIERGVGITNLVARPTRPGRRSWRPRSCAVRLTGWRPWWPSTVRVVAVVGLTASPQAFARPRAAAGRQDHPDAGPAELWVAPNPSGLNAHATVASLARDYAEVARAAAVRSEHTPAERPPRSLLADRQVLGRPRSQRAPPTGIRAQPRAAASGLAGS